MRVEKKAFPLGAAGRNALLHRLVFSGQWNLPEAALGAVRARSRRRRVERREQQAVVRRWIGRTAGAVGSIPQAG